MALRGFNQGVSTRDALLQRDPAWSPGAARREGDHRAPRHPVAEHELAQVRALLSSDPRGLIRWALGRFPAQRRVVVTGLQLEGVAVATMALALDPTVRVLTIDSGRLPAATLQYLDELRARWGRDVEVVRPDEEQVADYVSERGADAFYESPLDRLDCCHIRKVAPLERALAGVDCWMTGLRRGQSAGRADTSVVEIDHRHGGLVKLNPLAAWPEERVRAYLEAEGVPLHPLYGQGYRSIGCDPCTRAVRAGEDRRAGRWWWEDGVEKECGIHAGPSLRLAGESLEDGATR